MLSEKMLQTINNISEENIYDFLYKGEEVKKAFFDSFLNSSFQGWVHRIILNKYGDIFITGSMSSNTTLQSCYNGDSVELDNISACCDLKEDLLHWEDITSLDCKLEQFELWNALQGEPEIEELRVKIENCNQDFSLLHIYNNCYCLLEDKFRQLFPEKMLEIEKNTIDYYWENYFRDNLAESMLETLENLKEIESI